MIPSHYKNKELLKQLNILREYDSYRKEKLETKLRVISERDSRSTDKSGLFCARMVDMPSNEHEMTIKEELYEIVRRQNTAILLHY